MYQLELTKTHSAHKPEFVLKRDGKLLATGSIDACIDSKIPVYLNEIEGFEEGYIVSPVEITEIVSGIISYYLVEQNLCFEEMCAMSPLKTPSAFEQLGAMLGSEELAPIRKSLLSTYSCYAGRSDLNPEMKALVEAIEKSLVV